MTSSADLSSSVSIAEQAAGRRRPRNVPATGVLAPAARVPAKADWPGYLAALVRRGALSVTFDPHALSLLSRASGRGRAYPHELIVALCLLQAATGYSMRRTLGLAADLAGLARRDVQLPSVATWCNRRRDLDVIAALDQLGRQIAVAAATGPVVLLLDATGVSLRRDGDWNRNKHARGRTDARKGRFVKLHAGVDEQTGCVLTAVVTGGDGKGSGDSSQGPVLTATAAQGTELAVVIGDGAYDTRACHTAARQAGAKMVAPLAANAAYGLDPGRDIHLAQIGRLGPPLWKRKVGYHRRSLVESTFGALKDTTGHTSRATSRAGATAEIHARIALHNQWAADVATSLQPVHPTWVARQQPGRIA